MPGFPIARMLDQGAHGDILMQGSPTVKANLFPVVRMMDTYVCPLLGIGIIMGNCSMTVKANNIPIAHMGSMGMCAMALPTVVVTGSPTVKVGL